jgi:ketosteroid isomerase-like protein
MPPKESGARLEPTDGYIIQCSMADQAPNADVAELLGLARDFVEGFNSGDVERIMRFYADRYVDVNLEQPVQTKAEREEYYRRIIERGDTKVDVRPEEIVVAGEYAFVRGTILLFRKAESEKEPARLRYLEVARKYPDGWKAIWGLDAPIHS